MHEGVFIVNLSFGGRGQLNHRGGAENFEVLPWGGGHLSFKIVSGGGGGDHESFLMSCGPKEWNAAPGQI